MASRARVIMGPSALSRIPSGAAPGGVMSATKTVLHFTTVPGADVVHVENLVGEVLVEYARFDLRRKLCSASSFRISRALAMRSGVRRSDAYAARPIPSAANASTGAITLRLETPAARMATISPSAAMRPSPIRIPTSTPNGMVSGSTGGSVQPSSCSTVPRPTLFAAHQRLEQLVRVLQKNDEGGQQRAQQRAGQDLAEDVAPQ